MARPKKRWSELTTAQRASVIGLLALQAAIVALAQRDLSTRGAAELRGPAWVWRIATLQTAGAVAYLVVGRRRATA